MPTSHPRHSITETPELAALLNELRERLGKSMPSMTELVRRGAISQLREAQAHDEARQRDLDAFMDNMINGPAPDLVEPEAIRRTQRTP